MSVSTRSKRKKADALTPRELYWWRKLDAAGVPLKDLLFAFGGRRP